MAKRMFEFAEGSSNKFWEIWRDGTEVHTRYGKIGAAGQATVKDEGDEAAAVKLYTKLIAEKTKKGYAETGAAKAEAPKVTPKAKTEAEPAKTTKAPAKVAPAKAAKSASPAARRFEMDEKFWEVTLSGSAHTVRFGKIGAAGQEKTKEFASAAEAQKDYDKLIAEKTKKGYEETEGEDD